MDLTIFWKSWKTTSAAIVIILIWAAKFVGIAIPTDVATAISTILAAIGLIFSKDFDSSQGGAK